MVQTKHNQKSASQRSTRTPSPRNVIIVYEQPKVIVVRHYTKTIIPEVNPAEYRKQFDRILLDTSTLLALARRLNIQENLVRNIILFSHFLFLFLLLFHLNRLHLHKLDKSNEEEQEQ
jgi:hypothetical protein